MMSTICQSTNEEAVDFIWIKGRNRGRRAPARLASPHGRALRLSLPCIIAFASFAEARFFPFSPDHIALFDHSSCLETMGTPTARVCPFRSPQSKRIPPPFPHLCLARSHVFFAYIIGTRALMKRDRLTEALLIIQLTLYAPKVREFQALDLGGLV